MLKLIDTHAHLDSSQFNQDREEVIQNCIRNEINYIIDPAVNYESCKAVLELSHRHNPIYCCLGIHPHDAKEMSDEIMAGIEDMLKEEKVVAIGEIGLDYHYNFSPKEKQKEVFREFLKLAKKHKLPVVIHSRESDSDMINILESEMDESLTGQMHCFSSNYDIAQKILKFNFYISFTGSITFSNRLNDVVESIPIERLLLETDSPYMSPVPHRGKRNDPTRLVHVVKKISEIKGLSENEVSEITCKNAINLFNLLKRNNY
jgi:TatD DNase family protein